VLTALATFFRQDGIASRAARPGEDLVEIDGRRDVFG